MDAAQTFKRIFSFLAALLLVATMGQAATLVVDNNSVPLTGQIESQNVYVTSSDGSALSFDVAVSNPPSGIPQWLSATTAGCATSGPTSSTSCPTPATLSLSVTNDLGSFGAGPFTATVTLHPDNGGANKQITVNFYPGPGGIPGAITVTPSASDPISNVPIAYVTGQPPPTQQIVVAGTASYMVTASTLSGGNWLVVSAGGTTGTQIPSTSASQILTITLNSATAAALATSAYQGFVVVTGADGTSLATIDVNLSVNGGASGVVTASPSQLTFAYSTGASPLAVPLQTVVVSTPVGSSFSVTKDSSSWIVLESLPIGQIPGQFPVLVNPSGLAPGIYNGKVTVTVGAASQVVAVQLVVTADPVLWASIPNSGGTAVFSSQGSVSLPVSQTVSLLMTDGSSPALSVTSYPSWTSVLLNGNKLTIAPNVSGTAPAVLSDAVVVTAAGVANSPLSIPVVMVENGGGAAGALILNPSSFTFNALAGGAVPDPQPLSVSASSATAFKFAVSTANGLSWLQVSPSLGVATTNTTLTVTVSPTGLAASTNPYTGFISLTPIGGTQTQTIPVTLTVSPATGGNITTDTTSVNLTAQVGTQKQAATVTVSNVTGGTAPVLFNVTTTPASATWLKASPAQATTQSSVTITADPTGLSANTYQGQVTITPVGGNAVTVSVSFTVQALPVISASRTSFTFSYLAGGDVPPTQTVQVSGGAFTAAVTSGNDWLAVSPGAGNTTTNLTISVTPSGQSQGAHEGTITVSGANGTVGVVTLTVTLNVTSPLPTVTSVVNGASFLPGAIAGGEVISVFGTDLGPTTAVTAQLNAAGNLATTLGGVQLVVSGFPAPLIYASSTQVTAVVPYEVARYLQATVQVTYLNQRSNAITLGVTNTSPAIFTLNSAGSGPGARNADFSVNGPNNPVSRGGYVVFFMTGEGPLTPAGVTGKINPATGPGVAIAALPVAVLINNQPANWTYAGGIAGVVEGIMQLNVQIPEGVPSGTLPVLVLIGGNGSQSNVTVSVK